MVTLFVKNHMFFNQLIKNQGKYGPNLETLLRFCDLVEAGGNKAAAARKILVLLIVQARHAQGGKRFAWGTLGSFLFVMLTFWGVYLLSPLHQPPAP